MSTTRRVLRWHGGKGRLASRIVELLPPHAAYIEPYGGGAAVLLEKEPSEFEVYNDINGELVNFFRVLRDRPEDLVRAIELTPYARDEYAGAGEASADEVERARIFMVLSWMTLGGSEGRFRSATDWRRLLHHKEGGRAPPSVEWQGLASRLWGCSQRLRRVQIENRPAIEVLEKYAASNGVAYVDPPYPAGVRSGPKKYAGEMDTDEHQELLEVLNGLECAMVVSSYDNPLYARELTAARGWTKRDFTVTLQSTKAGKGQKRHDRVETVWIRPAQAPAARSTRRLQQGVLA